jgi:hypothetical protein
MEETKFHEFCMRMYNNYYSKEKVSIEIEAEINRVQNSKNQGNPDLVYLKQLNEFKKYYLGTEFTKISEQVFSWANEFMKRDSKK